MKNLVLRDYQKVMVKKGAKYFKETKPVPSIIVAPTAAGKSIIIAKIAKEVGEKILVIQPSKELLEQNYEKFIRLGGDAEIYSASLGEKEIGDVTYATIGSIVNVAWKFKELGISKVIIDECDRFPREPDGMLRRFLKAAGIKWVLGFTATPLKLQTNLGRDGSPISKLVMLTSRSNKGNFFKKVIHVEQISNMVEKKYWSKLEYFSFDFDTGDLIYNTTGADFTQKSMEKAYKKQDIETKIKNKVEQLYSRRSILIAVPSIDQAKSLANKLPSARAVYSQMPIGERREIIEDFKSGKLRIIVQVNILSVGFDYPELDTIIIGRPTASLSWYYQFVGRVTRIHPQKTEGLVIDFVGSVPRFGKVEELYFKEDEKKWKLFGEDKKLLTGIPMNEIGLHIEGEPSPFEEIDNSPPVIMTFGKYKGKEIKFIPGYYRDWMLNNFKWNKTNEHIKIEILKLKNLGI